MVNISHQDAGRLVFHDESEAVNLHSNQFGDRHHPSLISIPLDIFNIDGEVHQVAAF